MKKVLMSQKVQKQLFGKFYSQEISGPISFYKIASYQFKSQQIWFRPKSSLYIGLQPELCGTQILTLYFLLFHTSRKRYQMLQTIPIFQPI